jgi:PKD repeat protein
MKFRGSFGTTRRRTTAAVATALTAVGVLAVSLAPASASSSGPPTITADQGLYPAFNPAIHDYVIRCTGAPVQMSVNSPDGWGVSVDGSPMQRFAFNQSVPLATGQEFTFSVLHSHVTTTYYVRCMPRDFVNYTFTSNGTAPYTMFAVDGATGNYTTVMDSNGVPIWWMRTSSGATDSQVLPDGTYGFWDHGTAVDEIYSLSGQPIRSLVAQNGATDQHELLLLENHDYIIDSYVNRSGVNLSQFGGPTNTTVIDGEAEEITPSGQVVWVWNSSQHTSLSDTPQAWYDRQATFGAPYDIFHLNAVAPRINTIMISARHNDAVYGIDKPTGNILWKLGGTTRPESLTVVGDPQGSYPFGGQHDSRWQPDGSITVHDNNFGQAGQQPRVVHFSINPTNHTATYLDSFRDPSVTSALCCGSARRFSNGDTLVSWGYNPLVAMYDLSGHQLFGLHFPSSFSYRAIPVPPQVSITQLRSGMDAQFPRPVGGASKVPGAAFTASSSSTQVATPVSLDGSASTVSATGPVSYTWDFGDGHSGSGELASHSYKRPGLYTVRLTVRDGAGLADTASHAVTVREGAPLAPQARFLAPGATQAGHSVAFDGSDSLAQRATLVSYRWSFGDGGTASGEMVAHTYSQPGRYRVSLTVITSAGARNTRTETVQVR